MAQIPFQRLVIVKITKNNILEGYGGLEGLLVLVLTLRRATDCAFALWETLAYLLSTPLMVIAGMQSGHRYLKYLGGGVNAKCD